MKIVLDTETTGTNHRLVEILQLSIIDYDSDTVPMNECFKPDHKRRWFEAQRINGISPALVTDKRRIEDELIDVGQLNQPEFPPTRQRGALMMTATPSSTFCQVFVHFCH
jgi:DNA polymerase III epsilon subunit-like protein